MDSYHVIGESETTPPDSAGQKRQRRATGKVRGRSSSRLDSSIPPMSSEKTKRKVEKTKRRSSSSVNAKALKDETKLKRFVVALRQAAIARPRG